MGAGVGIKPTSGIVPFNHLLYLKDLTRLGNAKGVTLILQLSHAASNAKLQAQSETSLLLSS